MKTEMAGKSKGSAVALAERVPLTVNRKDWKWCFLYGYRRLEERLRIAAMPGIYMLGEKFPQADGEMAVHCFYVGKSYPATMRESIIKHIEGSEPNKPLRKHLRKIGHCFVASVSVPEEQIDGVEAYLIDLFGKKRNLLNDSLPEQSGEVEPIAVELPVFWQ